ncbi:hypothetical protein, partial [Burkholderia sp. Bp9142]|uniref:hypothetical protein n=1 Tax=Burkholderia sp. Bp9142 TaxID=2184573 RepID=UPI00390CB9C6
MELLPESVVNAIPGAVAEVSSVKLNEVGFDVLPATSVCRTCTSFVPSTALKLVFQVWPPSVEYSITAPVSTPDTLSVPTLVTWSVALLPESVVNATPGAAAEVSSVKLSEVGFDVLPATSVCRTCISFVPSTALKLVFQVWPPSVEYSITAPVSTPDTLSVPTLVMWSAALLPESVVNATPGAADEVSSVKLSEVGFDVLPATSVCRTCTSFTPSTALKLVFQVWPPSVEYSTTAPVSTPDTLSVPTLVMWSAALLPESVVNATPGAAAEVSSVKLSEVGSDVLPATSVCRTCTSFTPSTALKLVF